MFQISSVVKHVACILGVADLNVFGFDSILYSMYHFRFITNCTPFTAGLVMKANVYDFRLLPQRR